MRRVLKRMSMISLEKFPDYMDYLEVHPEEFGQLFNTILINVTAFFFFALKGLVVWPLAILMAAGAIIGGYGGARSAKHVNPRLVYYCVVAVGLLVSSWLFIKSFELMSRIRWTVGLVTDASLVAPIRPGSPCQAT